MLLVFCKKKNCTNPNSVDGINTTELHPATMTDACTIGCLINNDVWLPMGTNILGDLVCDINSLTGALQYNDYTYKKANISFYGQSSADGYLYKLFACDNDTNTGIVVKIFALKVAVRMNYL